MKYSDIDVLNFIEGKFNDEQVADILAQKNVDPELAEKIDLMQASLLPYQEAYDQQLIPELPKSLHANLKKIATVESADEPLSTVEKKGVQIPYKWVATFLFVGIGLGVLASSQLFSPLPGSDQQSIAKLHSENQLHLRWVERIADYQSLYVENTVKTIPENRFSLANGLLESLSAQNDFTVSIPDLTEFGYEFARAQELGFEGQTLIQLVYAKPGSMPLAYCLMPGGGASDLPLKLSQQRQLGVASWVSDKRHNVLVADESPSTLQKMHASILAI